MWTSSIGQTKSRQNIGRLCGGHTLVRRRAPVALPYSSCLRYLFRSLQAMLDILLKFLLAYQTEYGFARPNAIFEK